MPTYYEEKKRLLLELKAKTLNQLSAIQAEDSEQFLLSTESCNSIIGAINMLDMKKAPLTDQTWMELVELLLEIKTIREQISALIPLLYEKIKQKFEMEKRLNFAKRCYKQDNLPLPSIFLNKKV